MRNNARHPSLLLNPRAGLALLGATATLNLAPADQAPESTLPSSKAMRCGADRTRTVDVRAERQLCRRHVMRRSEGPQ